MLCSVSSPGGSKGGECGCHDYNHQVNSLFSLNMESMPFIPWVSYFGLLAWRLWLCRACACGETAKTCGRSPDKQNMVLRFVHTSFVLINSSFKKRRFCLVAGCDICSPCRWLAIVPLTSSVYPQWWFCEQSRVLPCCCHMGFPTDGSCVTGAAEDSCMCLFSPFEETCYVFFFFTSPGVIPKSYHLQPIQLIKDPFRQPREAVRMQIESSQPRQSIQRSG